jgi:hypothetical protein
MWMNEVYKSVWVGKHLFAVFPIMNGRKKRYYIAIAFQVF